jgi:hypothetical protein
MKEEAKINTVNGNGEIYPELRLLKRKNYICVNGNLPKLTKEELETRAGLNGEGTTDINY